MTEDTMIRVDPTNSEDEAGYDPTGSVREAFARLYTDGRAYAEAEMERQKLRAGIAGTAVRDAVILGAAGSILAFAGLVAFLVGMTLALAPLLGPGWAACAVFGISLLLALILVRIAKGRITKMKKAIGS